MVRMFKENQIITEREAEYGEKTVGLFLTGLIALRNK